MRLLHGLKARLRLLFNRRSAESRMDDEFRFHAEMETQKNIRLGMSPDEARRQAAIAFGGAQAHREVMRDERGIAWLGGLSLDFKLGFRMLVKYPGLTLVGGLAMAFAIWVGAVTFELVTLFVHPTLPLPGGDRIVQIRNWDVSSNGADARALHDFLVWRGSVKSVTDLGAWRDLEQNLITDDGDARPVEMAEVTASAFRIAPAIPLAGRVLVEGDERAGAPPVAVIGHNIWRTRFASDPRMVGRTVKLGDDYVTVVGVMPEGFEFPATHELWTPLRADLMEQAPREGPSIKVFGRLASGVTLEEAQAEFTAIGQRAAIERPATHEHLQPRVGAYAKVYFDLTSQDAAFLFAIDVFAVMLLVLICSNVALLLFARAATREVELVVRSALGASRRRLIAQLFAEALVLGSVAAAVGLVAANTSLHTWGRGFLEMNLGKLPFWYDITLSPLTVLYAVGLTVMGAVIAGVVPARKITHGLGLQLKQGTAGGGGLRFGGVWTAIIVTQVAVTVAFPALAYVEQQELLRIRAFDVGFAADEYLAARLEADAGAATSTGDSVARVAERARFGASLETLRARVAAEPGVAGVTFVDRLPRNPHVERKIELDQPATPASGAGSVQTIAPEVSLASIDPSYFDVLKAPLLAGRAFGVADLTPDARVVIVDQGFVDEVLQGRSAVGRRLRFVVNGASTDAERPWYQIVGVAKDLGMGYVTHRHRTAGVYMPTALHNASSLHMVVHVAGDPTALAPRVRTLATAVDPTLRLSDLQRVDRVTDGVQWVLGLWLRITVVLTSIALLLSLAGIYAVLSFTVARRTREIGVRVALGANRRRVVAAIFRRPLTQVAIGVGIGGAIVTAVALLTMSSGGLSLGQVGLLVAYAGFMFVVCMLACLVPTRRALRVEPTEALRAE